MHTYLANVRETRIGKIGTQRNSKIPTRICAIGAVGTVGARRGGGRGRGGTDNNVQRGSARGARAVPNSGHGGIVPHGGERCDHGATVRHGAASGVGGHTLMAALWVSTSGTMAWRRVVRNRCYACWCCWPATHADDSTVGEPIRHDGMAPHRSKEMLCLLVLLARRTR